MGWGLGETVVVSPAVHFPAQLAHPARCAHLRAAPLCQGQQLTPLDPTDPSFRALSGRLKFTVRRQKFNKDSLFFTVVPRS